MKGFPGSPIQLRVVGLTFRKGYPGTIDQIDRWLRKRPVPVQLQLDPDNDFDPYAVRVYVGKVWLGFLSKADAKRYNYDLHWNKFKYRAIVASVPREPENPRQPGLWIELTRR